jgi:hypothetical protein
MKYDIIESKEKSNFNELPPNFKEITEQEFAQSKFFTYMPEKTEYRQVNINGKHTDLRMFWMYDNTGYAIVSNYWDGKVIYYSFAKCEHIFDEKTVGKCLTEYTCKKCGYRETIDSSD